MDPRSLVNQVLNSPQLRASLEEAVRNAVNNQTQPITQRTGIPRQETPRTETQRHETPRTEVSNSLRSELTRLFPSSRRSVRSRRNTRVVPTTSDFTVREVILLTSATTTRTLRGAAKMSAFQAGRAFSQVRMNTGWSLVQLGENLRNLFKVPQLQFDILVPISGNLAPLTLEEGTELNGSVIRRIFNQKSLYIRPRETCGVEATETCASSTKSDDDHVDDVDDVDDWELPPAQLENESFQEDLRTAIQNSLDEGSSSVEPAIQNSLDEGSSSVEQILKKIYVDNHTDNITVVNVFRQQIWKCVERMLGRPTFNPFNDISVMFTDIDDVSEGAIDMGGPKREFFRLVLDEARNRIFEGPDHSKQLLCRIDFIEDESYLKAAILCGMSLIHGGPAPSFFSNDFYDLFTGEEVVLEIYDDDVNEMISKLTEATDLQEVNNILETNPIVGCPTMITDISRRDLIVKGIRTWYGLSRFKDIIGQFIDGFKKLKIYDVIRENKSQFKGIFCYEKKKLTAADVDRIFSPPNHSEMGSNRRALESRALCYFKDILLECDDQTVDLQIENVLVFCTGLDGEPPLGFPQKPSLTFTDGILPKANTCELSLAIPVGHNSYDNFKHFFIYGVKEGMVFGFE